MPKIEPVEITITTQNDEIIECYIVGIEEYNNKKYAALLDTENNSILLYRIVDTEKAIELDTISDEEIDNIRPLFSSYDVFLADQARSTNEEDELFPVPHKATLSCEELLKKFDFENNKSWFESKMKPSIQLISHYHEEYHTQGLTKIGGYPDVPSNFQWPKNNDGDLVFLTQLNFEQIKEYDDMNILPDKGILYFFYDVEYLPTYSDGESHQLIYIEDPSGLSPEDNHDTPFTEVYQYFVSRCSFPDIIEFDTYFDDQWYDYDAMTNWLSGGTQLLGNAKWVQDDPLETLKANMETSNFKKEDWVLLLQLDSVYEANMNWIDNGMLYFYIHKDDLVQKDFTNVKLVLQYN